MMGRRYRTGAGRSVTGRRYAAAAVCLCGLVLCLSGCRAGLQTGRTPEFVFTYAENQTGDYPTTAGARYFADRVKEESGGRIEILVYANAELGDENAAVEQVRFGGIDFARASLSSLNACSPKAIVLQMLYLYKDAEHMWRVLDGEIGAEIMASFEGSGVVGLSWYDAAARSFYSSKQPIRDIADLRGMKIRVQDADYMEDMVRCLGAEPEVLISSGAFERWDGHRGFGPLNCRMAWTGPATWRSSTVSAWWLWGTTITGCGVRLTDSRRRTVA